MPDSILPSSLSLSQLSQQMQEEECDKCGPSTSGRPGICLVPQAQEKKVSISDGNPQILRMAMEAMHEMYRMVLAEAAGERSNHAKILLVVVRKDGNDSHHPTYVKRKKRIGPL